MASMCPACRSVIGMSTECSPCVFCGFRALVEEYAGIESPIAAQVRQANSMAAMQQQAALGWYDQIAAQAAQAAQAVEQYAAGIKWAPRSSCKAKPAESRPICPCGQTVWTGALGYEANPICSDCSGDYAAMAYGKPRQDLDTRIAAVRTEPAEGDVGPWEAWATASWEEL